LDSFLNANQNYQLWTLFSSKLMGKTFNMYSLFEPKYLSNEICTHQLAFQPASLEDLFSVHWMNYRSYSDRNYLLIITTNMFDRKDLNMFSYFIRTIDTKIVNFLVTKNKQSTKVSIRSTYGTNWIQLNGKNKHPSHWDSTWNNKPIQSAGHKIRVTLGYDAELVEENKRCKWLENFVRGPMRCSKEIIGTEIVFQKYNLTAHFDGYPKTLLMTAFQNYSSVMDTCVLSNENAGVAKVA
jgi:hypothetical protein